jgi:hypothetical protein
MLQPHFRERAKVSMPARGPTDGGAALRPPPPPLLPEKEAETGRRWAVPRPCKGGRTRRVKLRRVGGVPPPPRDSPDLRARKSGGRPQRATPLAGAAGEPRCSYKFSSPPISARTHFLRDQQLQGGIQFAVFNHPRLSCVCHRMGGHHHQTPSQMCRGGVGDGLPKESTRRFFCPTARMSS